MKNFQVRVLYYNSSIFSFVGTLKIWIFEKIVFFKICGHEEFLWGWVLTFEIDELDVLKHSLYHITSMTSKNPNFKSHKFSEKMNLKICGLEISKMKIYHLIDPISDFDLLSRPKRPYLLPVNFMLINSMYFFIPTNFSEK